MLASNSLAAIRYEYDLRDRLIAENDLTAGRTSFAYDADGQLVQEAVAHGGLFGCPVPVVLRYQYDGRGQLSSILDPELGAWHFQYDPAGREIRRLDPNGLERRVGYRDSGAIEQVELRQDGVLQNSYAYEDFDPRESPRRIVDSAGGQVDIGYDAYSRVTSVAYQGDGTSESFEYDEAGNRTLQVDRSGQTRVFRRNEASALVAIEDGQGGVLESFAYDGAGRRIARTIISQGSSETYAYDALGRLTRHEDSGGGGFTLGWDASGHRRLSQDLGTGGLPSYYAGETLEFRGGEALRRVYPASFDRVLAEVSHPGGGPPVSNALYRDGRQDVVRIAGTDALGGTTLEATRLFETFGGRREGVVPASSVRRGFASRPLEESSRLVNMRARHYDPATGAFLQPDPMGFAAPQVYGYGQQNPYRFWDPNGLLARANGGTSGSWSYDDTSQGNSGTGATLPEEFQGYESELHELGRRLRDSPFRQAEQKGRALVGGQDVSGALRDSWIFGRTFDRVSWAREDQAFGDLNDRYNLVAFGRGIAEGASRPNAVPNSLYDQSFLISHRVGRFVPGVFVNPGGDIVFFGQPSGDIGSRICVQLSGGGGC